ETWITPIIHTLQGKKESQDRKELTKQQCKAARYTLLKGVLYRKGFSHPLLLCLSPSEADYIMREIHEDIYGDHLGGRLLVQKIRRQ
ncbi:hypothetical protein E1A91_D05G348900v1, partial [Gossypium mustelinum]